MNARLLHYMRPHGIHQPLRGFWTSSIGHTRSSKVPVWTANGHLQWIVQAIPKPSFTITDATARECRPYAEIRSA